VNRAADSLCLFKFSREIDRTTGNLQLAFPIFVPWLSDDQRVLSRSQLTVPKQFREDLGLGNGSPFAVMRLGDGLILLPEQRRFEQLCQQVSSSLTAAGVTSGDLLATLPDARNRVYERRYGKKPSASASRRHLRNRRGK
jgi:bifunctional DNA-binding transcriptional regulator/antitoxin component of YhaV-PrlF toxin-antitoxin module